MRSAQTKGPQLVNRGVLSGSLTGKFPSEKCLKGCEFQFDNQKHFIVEDTDSMKSNLKIFDKSFVGKYYSLKSNLQLMELLYEVPLPDVGYFLYRPQDLVDYEVFLIGTQKRAQEWDLKFEKYRKGDHILYLTQEGDKEKIDVLSEKSAYKCLGPKCLEYLKSL